MHNPSSTTKKTIIQMIEEAAVTFKGRPYLCDKDEQGWKSVSFDQASRISRSLAAALINRGYKKEDKAVIISEGRAPWVLTELALFRAGMVSVPLSLKLMLEEIPFRVNHSESKILFFSHITQAKILQVKEKLKGDLLYVCFDDKEDLLKEISEKTGLELGKNLISWKELLKEGESCEKELESVLRDRQVSMSSQDVVNICYTSGTTGNPKGIMLTHQNYYANIIGAIDRVTIPENWRTLVILPIDHSFAHTVALYIALERAISLYFVDARQGASSIVRNIGPNLKEVNPHFLLTVPALTGNFMKKMKSGVEAKGGFIAKLFNKGLAQGIAKHGNGFTKGGNGGLNYALCKLLIFPKLREAFGRNIQFCIGGGALLDVKQQQFFNAIGVPVFQGYGLTEAAPIISANSPKNYKFGSSGMVLSNIELKIMKDPKKEASPGEKGEIVIRGDNVMKGYLKNPQASAEVMKDGWLFTGDLGYMDKDGFLVVVGREKALLISNDGEKYSPEEIEEAITNCSDWIDQCMLWCDHKVYTSALLVLDRDKLSTLKGYTPEEQLDRIHQELNRFKQDPSFKGKFPSQWLPGTFQIIEEPFSEQNQMINSTMKMVRFKITETYRERIDYMYSPDGKQWDNPKNRDVIKSLI